MSGRNLKSQTENEETKTRLKEMVDANPIPNPCPEMEQLGYEYKYQKGLIDKTQFYTRLTEDTIVYVHPQRRIQFNLASRTIVISETEDNAQYYGGRPTLFFHPNLIKAMNEIMDRLGWNESE